MDTLYMQNQRRYEYVEKLNSGVYGWTEGEWFINRNKVRFKCDKEPLVAYRRKILPDTTVHHFQLKLLLGDTKAPVSIELVSLFKNKLVVAGAEKQKNVVMINSTDFDSIVIYTTLFRPIRLGRQNTGNVGYILRIYPQERLYELDKLAFRFTGKTLKCFRTKEYSNHSTVFNKLK
jgi:hypothetical protein